MSDYRFSFFRAGGVDQVVLKTGADLAALPKLDKKLWVALACPVKGTAIDEKTLKMLDTDEDGMLRPPEVLAALDWAKKAFKSLDVLLEKGEDLPLAQLDDSTDEGKSVLASAKRILEDQKKSGKSISLDHVLATQEAFADTKLNGDGVVPKESADDELVALAIEEVMKGAGEVPDRSGKPGVNKELVEKYFADIEARLAWAKEAAGVSPLAEATEKAASALADVDEKIEDFFTRCQIAAFDTRGQALLSASEGALTDLGQKSLAQTADDVAKLPLAKIDANAQLPLETGLNPAWRAKMAAFREHTVTPILGAKKVLTEADFVTLRERLQGFRDWKGKRGTYTCDNVDDARATVLVEGGYKDKILTLIEKDLELAAEYDAITSVERAVRMRRDYAKLLRNFVNFSDFYGSKKASFQAGTLFLDARSCDLCLVVNDAGKHASLAAFSNAYLVYCDCTRASGETMQIACAFTAGDVDNLMVGRNGVFYDRQGKDWSATITKIIEAPISVRQAFWTPYKRLIRLVEETFAKRAAEKDKESMAQVDGAAAAAATADKAPPAPPADPAAPPKKMDVGMVAAIGVAVAGVAGFLTSVIGMFLGLGIFMPLGILALLLAISGPSMLIAWLKLRKRNLGPILDANGWAVNAMARINVPFGTSLTHLRELPEGASRTADDPFAEKPTPWGLYIFLVVLLGLGVAWTMGKVDRFLPEKARSSTVFKQPEAPKEPAAAAPAK
ncbi:MAG: hypothetical protein IPK71_35230 [Myxococcales bacterium]|nr:hypothetical protein [Myxococcales bacterium]